MVVGETKLIATDRAGHRQADRTDRSGRQAQTLEIGTNGILRTGKVGCRQHLDRLQLLVFPQGKTCIGTANVTDQR
ncbi:hypothetical protein D3C81_2238630 [compost metagenome]